MLNFKDFKLKLDEGSFVTPKGTLGSDEKDSTTYLHTPDADVKIMHIAAMYGDATFETTLFTHLLERKFKVAIVDNDVYNSLSMALRDNLLDEEDIDQLYNLVNSKDLDTRTDNYKKLIQFINDYKNVENFDFNLLVNDICKKYQLNKEESFLDTLEKAIDSGKIDILDLRNIYHSTELPIYTKKNEGKTFPKFSEYDNLADDVKVFKKTADKIEKVNMDEYDIVKIIDIISPTEVEKIEEMQVLNLGTTMPKDIKRGDQMYLTVMLQPKNKTSAYNATNTMGVVRVRVMDIFQGLNILKSKGLM